MRAHLCLVCLSLLSIGCAAKNAQFISSPQGNESSSDVDQQQASSPPPAADRISTTSPADIPEGTKTSAFEVLQRKRMEWINSSIKLGVIRKIETRGSLPYLQVNVWVDSTFMRLDFDSKVTACQIVWAYYFENPEPNHKYAYSETVDLKDVILGKTVGSYSPFSVFHPGLNMK